MSRVQLPLVSLEFFIDVILPAIPWLWGAQPLTEMNARNISWGVKAAIALGWEPYHFQVHLSWNLGALPSWNFQGLSRPVQRLHYFVVVVVVVVCCCFNVMWMYVGWGSYMFCVVKCTLKWNNWWNWSNWKNLNTVLHLEESLPYSTRGIGSRRIRGMRHVACMERRIMHAELWFENLKKRGCLNGVGISWRIILKSVWKH